MTWLMVFKFYFPANVKSYNEMYPESNQRLMNFYYSNGMISSINGVRDGELLTYVTFQSNDAKKNIENIQGSNIDYVSRKEYNVMNGITQRIIYDGPESEYGESP